MDITRVKKLFILASLIVIASLIGVLFQSDLIVVGNQVATDVGIVKEQKINVFTTQGGYVRYFEENTPDEELTRPALSSINAKLKIARIGIEGNIVEGNDESMLDKGFWHFPSASPFAKKGNVIIIGHRFLKLPPNKDTFYHLNWVKVGDEIVIKTTEGSVKYSVREQKIVSKTDTYILEQTLNAQLTLITCHPLWTSSERLVIIADKVEENYDQ